MFADVRKDLKMGSPQITRVGPKSHGKYPFQRQQRGKHTHTGEGHVKTEAGIGVPWPRAPEAERGEDASSPEPSKGVWPCLHLDVRHPAPSTVRKYISVAVSQPGCG